MRPPWWKRLPGGPPAIELDAAKPPAEPEHVAHAPMTDADRAEMWKRTAETRRIDNLNLRDENDRLRADLALAEHARRRLVECGHEDTLRQYDHDRRVCQREHVDEIDRLNAQIARLRWQAGHGEGDERERLRAENDALRYDARQPF